ncbi:MAG: glycosyltransferase family 4 protein [Oculatellaceae cyanobacterium Prado106]|jgi:glycosyltransferase involved in cell wall biosynthesis|nr:glycosyltransferase family 4 protein [Oculatellaceae cyanobacterium Prado106]
MHWNVVAPFIDNVEGRNVTWLTPYVPGNHQFSCIRRPGRELNWHEKAAPETSYAEWKTLWQQSRAAVETVQGGVITVLPQLAALVGMQKSLTFQKFPIVSWWFNTNLYRGHKRWLSQAAMQSINRFVVHNSCEAKAYSRWLGVPVERFKFVPLQAPLHPITETEDTESPFVLAVGSAYRDYPLLFEAVKRLGFRTIVVSGPRVMQGMDIPSMVETPFGVKKPEIISLLQRARLVVTPMTTEGLTAGTAAIVEALTMGCPIIATNRSGVEDYIRDGETGLYVRPHSLEDLTAAIDRLWHDPFLRAHLRKQARQYAQENLTDEAVGTALGQILNQVAEEAQEESNRKYYSLFPRTLL